TNRVPNQHEMIYEACALQPWLRHNPLKLELSSISAHLIKAKELIKAVCPPLLIPTLTRLFRGVRRRLQYRAGAGQADVIIRDYVTLDDMDIVLSFWWFDGWWSDPYLTFYLLPIENSSAKIIGWFYDAIPLHLNAERETVISVDDFMSAVSCLVLK